MALHPGGVFFYQVWIYFNEIIELQKPTSEGAVLFYFQFPDVGIRQMEPV